MRVAVALIALAATLISGSAATASQIPAHAYVALQAAKDARTPEAVKKLLEKNRDAYLSGAAGPDIAQISYMAREKRGEDHPGARGHDGKTGKICAAMLKVAGSLPDETERDAATAFALGWLTHYHTDLVIHHLVNEFGGHYYTASVKRHKELELVECEHAIKRGGEDVLAARVKTEAVRIQLVNDAFAAVYPEEKAYKLAPEPEPPKDEGGWAWLTRRFNEYTEPKDFVTGLDNIRGWIAGSSTWMVSAHGAEEPPPAGIYTALLLGTPPTTKQYDQLMDPLRIDDVIVRLPDKSREETKAKLIVKYTIHDLALHKLFCLKWDTRIVAATKNVVDDLVKWAGDPNSLNPPDRNLTDGWWEGSVYSSSKEYPGNPKITRMLADLKITTKEGKELSPSWDTKPWVEIPLAAEGKPAKEGQIGQTGWNGHYAGSTTWELEFDPEGATGFDVELRLALAESEGKLWGWQKEGMTVEAEWRKPGESKAVDLIFCIDGTGSMDNEIAVVRENVARIMKEVKEKTKDTRVKLVVYRDHPKEDEADPPPVIEEFEFTTATETVQRYVNAIKTEGGGDTPELVHTGLMTALKSKWRDGVVKIVVLMGDAAPKEGGGEKFTIDDVERKALEVDPADIYPILIPVGGAVSVAAKEAFTEIAKRCRGEVFTIESASELPDKIIAAVGRAVDASSADTPSPVSGLTGGGGSGLAPIPLPQPPPAPGRSLAGPAIAMWVLCMALAAGVALVLLRRRPRLGVVGHLVAGPQRVPLSKASITLGRGAECDIRIADSRASGVHAKLSRSDGGYAIADQGSTNGTLVNGREVTAATILRSGDVIRIGDTELRYESSPGAAAR